MSDILFSKIIKKQKPFVKQKTALIGSRVGLANPGLGISRIPAGITFFGRALLWWD